MKNWLEDAISHMTLSRPCEEYLLSRGAKRESFEMLGEFTWRTLKKPPPDPKFIDEFGELGKSLNGMLTVPLWSPKGKLIGIEAKSIRKKVLARYLLPQAYWNPVWVAYKDIAEKIWNGATVWIVEGRFDFYTMEWVVPEGDVVLSSLRAWLTPHHLDYLRRLKPFQVYIVYDMDETGEKGAKYACDVLNRDGIFTENIKYRGGKDPNEIWKKGGLPALQNAFSEFCFGGV